MASAVRLSVVLAGIAIVARAQAEEPPPQEVTVTGLKRETLLQRTPTAITAVPGTTLDSSGTEDVSELGRLAPSLTVVDSGLSNVRLAIRGIQAAGEPTVGVYYDETPVTGSVGASNDAAGSTPGLKLFDVDRVEVLRGPQGTLFGASSMGGAIRVIHRMPIFDYEGAVEAIGTSTPGGNVGYRVQGMANAPLIDGLLAARAVVYDEQRGGYIDNTFLHQQDINDEHSTGGRLLLRAVPWTHLTVDLAVHVQRTTGQVPLWTKGGGDYESLAQTQMPSDELFSIYNLTSRWDMGAIETTGVVSYSTRRLEQVSADSSYFFAADLNNPKICAKLQGGQPCTPDALNAFNAHVRDQIPSAIYPRQTTDTTSAELRVGSKARAPFAWTAGVFYSARQSKADISGRRADAASGELFSPPSIQYTRLVDDRLSQLAAFGDVSLSLFDKLTLSAGTRAFTYHREVEGQITVPFDLIGAAPTPDTTTSFDEHGLVSRFAAGYEMVPDYFIYAQAAQGFRPGGVNQVTGLPAALAPYQADSLWDYEVGLKTSWLRRRLTMNVDGYRMDWDNMQVTGSRPDGLFRFISNAGTARVTGLELEVAFRPITGLQVDARTALTHAVLTEDQVNANVVAPGRRGDRIPYVPETSGGIGAQYARSLSTGIIGFARVDANWVGSSFSELRPNNPLNRHLDPYGLVSARLGVQSPTTLWDAFLFVSNATGAVAIQYATVTPVSAGQTLVTSAPPRTFGAELRKRF
jgi:outer membrane receptor protein involved in Fe transport